jgi:NAD(P)-dependent dehydrogenase (short-subunit alcohol dehydrogenase family)
VAADLKGKVAVVTGGNRGIGFALCRMLAREGATVVLGSRDLAKGLEAGRRLGDEGAEVAVQQLDVTVQESVEEFAGRLEGEFGRLDLLVNNAGIMPNKKGPLQATLEKRMRCGASTPWVPGASPGRSCRSCFAAAGDASPTSPARQGACSV